MAYEITDTDNELAKLRQIVNEALAGGQQFTPSDENVIETFSQGNKGDSFGQTSGLKSDTPFVANITDQLEDGTPTLVFDRINLSSSLTIVDYIVPIVNIDLKLINFKPAPGTHVKFTPKVGRTLVIKTGGDFTNTSDITISDDEYLECVFYNETETGITGGGFKPHKIDITGGGGEFFGPWTADHNAGGFNLFNSTGIFFDASFLTGVVFNAGGVGLIAPIGDTIDVFINNLVTPKFGFTETSLETNVPLNFANPGNRIINSLDVINFDEPNTSIRSLSTGIRHDAPSTSSHRFRINVDEKMEIDQFGTNFEDNVTLKDNKLLTIFDFANANFLQIFQNVFDQSQSIISVADRLMFQRAASDIMELSSQGIFMPDSKTITFDDLLTADTFQISQFAGEAILNYTGDMIITESGSPIFTLGGLLIEVEKDMDMKNNEINNIFTSEIEENFTAGGVPIRPVNGAKLFVREQFADPTKRELRVYFPTGVSQLISSEP